MEQTPIYDALAAERGDPLADKPAHTTDQDPAAETTGPEPDEMDSESDRSAA